MRAYVPDFQMELATDLSSALQLVGKGYRPFAGGTDIMVLFNAGKLPPGAFVGIRRVKELGLIAVDEDLIEIGAGVTYTQLHEHAGVATHLPLLAQAARWTGGIANQNRGTLGGNIANASPAADSASVLLAYEAELRLVSQRGERWIQYAQFHLGYKKLALEEDEIIASIRFRKPKAGTAQYGRKVGTRRAQAIAKVSFAATADVSERRFRVAIGSAAPVPFRCFKTEEFLANELLTQMVISEAKRVLGEEISPITDIRSTRDYRLTVSENLLGEFLESLL